MATRKARKVVEQDEMTVVVVAVGVVATGSHIATTGKKPSSEAVVARSHGRVKGIHHPRPWMPAT
jgi:hypothetical protein